MFSSDSDVIFLDIIEKWYQHNHIFKLNRAIDHKEIEVSSEQCDVMFFVFLLLEIEYNRRNRNFIWTLCFTGGALIETMLMNNISHLVGCYQIIKKNLLLFSRHVIHRNLSSELPSRSLSGLRNSHMCVELKLLFGEWMNGRETRRNCGFHLTVYAHSTSSAAFSPRDDQDFTQEEMRNY